MTNITVTFGLFDVTAKADSAPICSQAESFCDIVADLKAETVPELPRYATCEPNAFLLDGSCALFPQIPEDNFMGLWSNSLSNAQGDFDMPLTLTVSFTQPHSSMGITLGFWKSANEWANKVHIAWKNSTGQTITQALFYPDSALYFAQKKVENYAALVFTFYSTNKPYRRLKLSSIDYGIKLVFANEDVLNANLVEEVDMLSGEISINTLFFSLHSASGIFNPLNDAGANSVLQQRQAITVACDCNGTVRNMGSFYLSDWEAGTYTVADFTATDILGILDCETFYGGIYNTTAYALACQILSGYHFVLEESLHNIPVCGYLPICTKREALQQLAISICAVVDCSRSDTIKIYAAPTRPSSNITNGRKWLGGKIAVNSVVTGVSVTAHCYTLSNQMKEIAKDILDIGTHKILFSGPYSVQTCTGATLTESHVNYAIVTVDTESAEVTLQGYPYEETTLEVAKNASNIPVGTAPNPLKITSATLISPARAQAVAANALNYCERRYVHTFEMVGGNELLGDMVIVDCDAGTRLRGAIEQLEIDLTGGFVSKCKVIGERLDAAAMLYSGECFASERSVL